MAKSPKFPRPKGNRGRETRWWLQILEKLSRLKGNRHRGTRCWCQIFYRKWKYGRFAHAQWKICNI